MSVWTDTAMEQLRDGEMEADNALDLIGALMREYGWTGTIFTANDVNVVVHEDDDPDSDGEDADWSDKEELLTPAIIEALQWGRFWSRAIPEILTERGNDLMPTIHISGSGAFDIVNDVWLETYRFNADGSPLAQ